MPRGETGTTVASEIDRHVIASAFTCALNDPLPDDHVAGRRSTLALDVVASEARRALASGGLAPWQARKLTAHVEENISKRVSLVDAASVVGISSSYLSRAFKRTFRQSFHQYLIGCRLEYARKLLTTANLSLSQIALECGLSDQSHLTRLFRRDFGASPNAWRRAQRAVIASRILDDGRQVGRGH